MHAKKIDRLIFLSTQLFYKKRIESSSAFMFWKEVHELFLLLTEYGLSTQSLAQSGIFPAHRPLPYDAD